MKIIVVDDLSSALGLYDFNNNIKTAQCLNLKHIISKRKRERESKLTYFDHPNKNIDRDLRITRVLVK